MFCCVPVRAELGKRMMRRKPARRQTPRRDKANVMRAKISSSISVCQVQLKQLPSSRQNWSFLTERMNFLFSECKVQCCSDMRSSNGETMDNTCAHALTVPLFVPLSSMACFSEGWSYLLPKRKLQTVDPVTLVMLAVAFVVYRCLLLF